MFTMGLGLGDMIKILRTHVVVMICNTLAPMCVLADFNSGLTAYKNQEFLLAYEEWKPLAKMGDPHAQSNLGVMYSQGIGVPVDYKSAIMWWKRAAEQGHAKARYNLGVMFQIGHFGFY